MLRTALLALALGACTASTTTAPMAPSSAPPPPPASEPVATGTEFDPSGWTVLGEQTVEGRGDRDVIEVGGKEAGRFDRVAIVVQDSDVEVEDIVILFGNGTTFEPKMKHFFREGTRSRVIDLPGKDRAIRAIELHYSNTPGTGKARVQVWGRAR
jgi:hypothetical protein